MTQEANDQPLLDASIRMDNLPVGGRNIKITTTQAEREAIAERLKIDALDRMTAELKATPIKGGVQVSGALSAVVTQACVVTFAPLTQEIEEKYDRIFLVGEDESKSRAAGSEVFVDLEGEDVPDYFEGPEVDFSQLLLEILALAIDPFPRAPDAKLDTTGDNKEDISPFAVLKGLKTSGD